MSKKKPHAPYTKTVWGSVCLLLIFGVQTDSLADEDRQQQLEIAGLYLELMKDLPKDAELVNAPYPQGFSVYGGAKKKVDKKSMIKGGRALRITAGKPKRNAHDRGANVKTTADIRSGDTLCLIYWARSINPPEENFTGWLSSVGIQQASEPYTTVSSSAADLSYEWKAYTSKTIAPQAFEAGEAQVFFHFGDVKQRFELGPAYLFNLGQGIEPDFKSNACGKGPA